MCGEEGEEVLPTISTVWECAYINYKDVNGKEGWECQWCGLSFKPRHATRAMRHVLKMKGGDIAICKAVISARYRNRYQALYDRQYARIDSKRKSDETISDSVTVQQEAAVKSLLDTRKQPGVSGLRKSSHSFSTSLVAFASGGSASSSSSTSLQGQRSVAAMHQLDIRRSNEQRCHGGNGNCRLLSLREYPRCSGGITSIQATDKCVSSSWRQVCSSKCT